LLADWQTHLFFPLSDSIMKTATVELVGCDRLANVDLLGAAIKHHCTMGRDSDCPNYHHCTDDGTCCPNRRM
jgi:hypothetical protein